MSQPRDAVQFMKEHIRRHVQSAGGDADDAAGIELAGLVRMVSNLFEAIGSQSWETGEMSTARRGLLFRLLAEERAGNPAGLTPSFLSRCHRVSRNTISALLRGLEEQGLIQRARDPHDLRVYRIVLSDDGRALAESFLPGLLAESNRLVSGLSREEQAQLGELLHKLYLSLLAHSDAVDPELAYRPPAT